ncbi:MAG: hypothetical protein IH795_03310, partial [Bacteroidetes bacterium]|nr:hypothetical protein [Bacteroidota bacterium]
SPIQHAGGIRDTIRSCHIPAYLTASIAYGFYYVSDYEKFTAILAFAGGTTVGADLQGIKLIRNFESIEIDVETIIQEGSSATDFGLQSGDQIFVPRTWWADARRFTIILSALALIVTIIAIIL